jgi:HK97 family phage portal protein
MIRDFFRRKSKPAPSSSYRDDKEHDTKKREYIEFRLGVPIYNFSSYQSYIDAGTKKVWAAMRAVRLISAAAISAKFKIVDGSDSGEAANVAISPRDNDSVRFAKGGFIAKPNPYDTWEELIEMTVAHLEFTGDAYWAKDDMDALGRPTSFFPLLPQHMKILPSKEDKIAGYSYEVNGGKVSYRADQIIHFKYVNPNDMINGLGTIASGQNLYERAIAKGDIENKFLESGAQPSGVMTLDDASVSDEDEWNKLKKRFQAEYGGKKNAGKTAFLNGKWTYHKLGMTMAEMEAIASEKWTIEQIFLNHGVPLSVAGIQGAANYATAKQDEQNFRRYKVVPVIDIIVGKLNADGFIQKLNPTFKLVYELYGVIDTEQIQKVFTPLLREGVITRNEFRELLGLRRMDNPHMDQITIMSHSIPIELAGLANLSNDDMLRVFGDIVGGATEEATDDLPGGDSEDDEDEGDPAPPPKKSKAYPAKPKPRAKRKR